MKGRIKFFVFIVVVQIIIISFYLYNISKKTNTLGEASVNPIKKDNIIAEPVDGLKYFYEPVPDSLAKYSVSWTSQTTNVTINKDSLNERFDYTAEKPSTTFRIITLGDSFTFGLFVDTKDNYSEQLEDLLNNNLKCVNYKKFEVINLGVHGYEIQYEVERFKLRGEKYKPDLLIWYLSDNSFNRLNEYVIPKVEEIRKKLNVTDESTRMFQKGKYYPDYTKAMELMLQELGKKNILEMQTNNLYQMNSYFAGPILIATFPFTQVEYKDTLSQFIKSRSNSFFFDGISNIYAIKDAAFPDSHPSQKGHKIIAQDLFNYLTKNKIIPCN